MKVLVLIEQSAPSRYWEAALPLLRRRGIDATLATVRAGGPLTDSLVASGVPVVSFGATRSLDYPFVAWKLAKLVRQEEFDVVHACESIPASISGISRLGGARAIRLFHRQHNVCPQKTRVFHNLANRTSHFVMACSGSTKAFAHQVDGFDASKIFVAYNGIAPLRDVPEAEVKLLRTNLGIGNHDKTITIVARLRPEKGHETLFEAAELIAPQIKGGLNVVVVGAGDYQSEILAASKRHLGVKYHFVGHQEDVSPWFSLGDVISMPSYIEPFGLVAAEAMSSGKPLIASGVDGLLEVVEDGVSGLLVPPKDVNSLAKALAKVLSSPKLGEELGAGGKRRVNEKFSMEKMVEGWVDCYKWVLIRCS